MKNLHLCAIILILVAGPAWAQPQAPADEGPRGHDNPDCRDCHLRTAGVAARPAVSAGECRSCHGKHFRGLQTHLGFHGAASQDRCLECHSYHDPGRVQTTRGAIALKSLAGIDTGHCLGCHADGGLHNLNEAHQAAADLYHQRTEELRDLSPSQGCLLCHGDQSASPIWKAYTGSELTFNEHASHPYEVVVNPGQGSYAHRIRRDIDPSIPLFESRIECASCHDLTSETPDLVRTGGANSDLCLGCHQFKDQDPPEKQALMATLARSRD